MYKIIYHPKVANDLAGLSSDWQEKIKWVIQEKLTTSPDIYGKPLRKSLKGHWKLRVGDYRIIFKIEKDLVKILIIGHRSVVYNQTEKRI